MRAQRRRLRPDRGLRRIFCGLLNSTKDLVATWLWALEHLEVKCKKYKPKWNQWMDSAVCPSRALGFHSIHAEAQTERMSKFEASCARAPAEIPPLAFCWGGGGAKTWLLLGNCYSSFFAYCGLVVEIQIHLTAKTYFVAPLPTSTKKMGRISLWSPFRPT